MNTVGGMMIILPQLANMPMFANDKRLVMFKDGLWIGLFAPSLQQSQNAYGRLKAGLQSDYAVPILEEFGYDFLTSNGEKVSLSNGSFCTARSASDNANIEGDSYKLIICDECQDIGTFKLRKSIHPMGAAYNATLVKIGTTTTFKGDFYEAIERNKKDFVEGRIRIRNHFEYDGTIGAKYNEKYAKYLEKEKYRLGEDSDEYKMSYMLKWILERGMFIDIDLLEKNCGIIDANRVAYDKKSYCVAGIDLAKRDDKTVITVVKVDWDNPVIHEEDKSSISGLDEGFVAYETIILDWRELNGDDYETQYYEIVDYLSNFNIKRIMIDATKEEGMCDRLQANFGDKIDVVPCIFSSGFKSDMYKHLDTEIKAKRAKFPMSDEVKNSKEYKKFSQEMADLEKDYRGQLLVVSHPNIRGAHDDYCLSLDTEILTKDGFKKYNQLTTDDLVAKVEDNKITYVKPNKIIYKDYKGKMYRFKSKDLCLEVTENHKMLTRHRKSGRELVMLSQELDMLPTNTRYNTLSIPVAPKQICKDYDISDNMIKQIAWFITEGWINKDSRYNTYRYSFGQSQHKPHYHDICKFIDEMNLKPYTYTRKDGVTYWTFHKKDNKLFDSILKEGIHRVPREWLSNFSQRQLKLLLDTLMQGDGTISRNTYHTKDLGLAQDIQELCHKLGIKASIRPRTYQGYTMYNVYLMSKDETRIQEVETYNYEGKVWCVNVDNGFIVTRCNNKIAVTGNCDSWALAVYGTKYQTENDVIETSNNNKMYQPLVQQSNFMASRNRRTAKRR